MAKVKTKISPLQDRVLVRRLDEGKRRPRGDHPSGLGKRKAPGGQGSVGGSRQGHRRRQAPGTRAQEGDRILFAKYAGTEVKVDGEDLLIMREDDVLAVVK